jgi:hypothetical protein
MIILIINVTPFSTVCKQISNNRIRYSTINKNIKNINSKLVFTLTLRSSNNYEEKEIIIKLPTVFDPIQG